jgi:hypothetical protein
MNFVTPTWSQALLLPVVVLAFFVPGWLMARRWPTPVPVVTALLGSGAALLLLVLGLDALRLPLHAGTLGLGFAAAAAALVWRWPADRPLFGRPAAVAPPRAWWWLLPIACAAASTGLRAVLDPLCGYDASFRWDYLARLFLAHQSLAGYPPLTAADFELYSWPDGIPPLIPLLNLWIYAGTGTIAPVLTGVRVIGEAGLLGLLVYRYARLLWGEGGGLPAVAALGSSALALWSVQTAQETGMLAISLVAMLYLLELHRREPRLRYVLWAAVAAAVGALSREYGLSYPLLGLAVLLARRQARAAAWFALLAAAVAAPWYVRNWVLTGNPLYPQTLGGLFPGNAVHEEQMSYYRQQWGLRTSPAEVRLIPLFLLVLAGGVTLTGLAGLLRLRTRAALPAAGAALVGAIWFFLNLPQSGGGWGYANRVLLPTLALFAVLSGWLGTVARRWQWVLAVPLTLLAIDAGRRAWMQPEYPLAEALPYSFQHWRTTFAFMHDPVPMQLWRRVARDAAGGGVVVDHPAHHVLLTMVNGNAIPWVSPALAPSFDDRLPFDEALARLRRANVRYATFNPYNPITGRLIHAHPFWRELFRREPTGHSGQLLIYDLAAPLPPRAPAPPAR